MLYLKKKNPQISWRTFVMIILLTKFVKVRTRFLSLLKKRKEKPNMSCVEKTLLSMSCVLFLSLNIQKKEALMSDIKLLTWNGKSKFSIN
jgi:hypothetical protein